MCLACDLFCSNLSRVDNGGSQKPAVTHNKGRICLGTAKIPFDISKYGGVVGCVLTQASSARRVRISVWNSDPAVC